MTKVEAIKKVMDENSGTATWETIYNNIERYYPTAKNSVVWQAAIRGVLYRELKNNRNFKKIGLGIFALADYREETEKITERDTIRMHSFIEGVCIELGNFEKFDTFTADQSALFKDNIYLRDMVTLSTVPLFTYEEIVEASKRIDVLWFNKRGFKFPKRVFEVVHSIGTLGEALNRTYQLKEFDLDFYIVGRNKHKRRFEDKVSREPYNRIKQRYVYKNYDEIIEFYNRKLEIERMAFFK